MLVCLTILFHRCTTGRPYRTNNGTVNQVRSSFYELRKILKQVTHNVKKLLQIWNVDSGAEYGLCTVHDTPPFLCNWWRCSRSI